MRLQHLLLLIATGGCCDPGVSAVRPTAVETVAFAGSQDAAFSAAVRAVMLTGLTLSGSDRQSGIVQTEWKQTWVSDIGLNILAGTDVTAIRRASFSLVVDGDAVIITPSVESCQRGACQSTGNMSAEEVTLLTRLRANFVHSLSSTGARHVAGSDFYAVDPPEVPNAAVLPADQGQIILRTGSGVREVRLQAPIELVFTNGAKVRGILDAATDDLVQIRAGDSTRRYRRSDISGVTQF